MGRPSNFEGLRCGVRTAPCWSRLSMVRIGTVFGLMGAGIALGQTAPAPVILISIDTLRADHLGAYGYSKIRTPNIDSFAQRGTLLTQAESQIPLTLPSHTSMMTSTYPFRNRIEENAEPVPGGAVTLAEVLRSHGYKTAAFIGSVFLERQMGLDQGFDFYDSPFDSNTFPAGAALAGPLPGRDRRDGALVIRAAQQWLAANNGSPVFAFVHLFDLHKPYPVSYDGQIRYVDGLMGTFKQSLIRLGLWDRALVILVSDHGEGLGEHGEDSHGYFIYESTLHVPLIFHWPAGAASHPARVDDPAGLIDVAPTVLDFLRLPEPASFEGTDLFGQSHPVFSESVHAHDAFGWAPLRSLREGEYKYIAAPRPEFYDLHADPRELNNLIRGGAMPAKAEELRGELASLMARDAPKEAVVPQISAGSRALLDSLGYLAPGPRATLGEAGPDPKDRLAEFRWYEDAWVQIYYRRLDQGIAKLEQVLAHDPQNLLARRDLGDAYVEKKEFAKARTAYMAVLAEEPEDYEAQFALGVTAGKLGFLDEAKEHLEAACRIEPGAEAAARELEFVLEKMKTQGRSPAAGRKP